jgi:predicted nuclease of predicted toxin-antitoxin system
MKLLLDQGLPRSAGPALTAAGHIVFHVADVGLSKATDEQILAEAVARDAAVVTIDADFHALLALSHATRPSVIRLRVQGVGSDRIVRLVLSILALCNEDLAAGAVVTSDETRARVRRLPLVP